MCLFYMMLDYCILKSFYLKGLPFKTSEAEVRVSTPMGMSQTMLRNSMNNIGNIKNIAIAESMLAMLPASSMCADSLVSMW
ncbi:hypothetical protein DC20_19125 [Rufibacter tibetensis]|uniref:Uncharacterized protein n=1 Tax=Rufibacter tibetensis TaxID=512763 RepID=A0A0P0CYZ8_9BACT|nr:hypothetical protein DC20_19125 [Rufibacter tibetensis]